MNGRPEFARQSQSKIEVQAHTVQRYLELATGPVTARTLAAICNVTGDVQTQRRKVREVVRHCRTINGTRICATTGKPGTEAGYWMARDAAEWAAYMNARREHAVFTFVEVKRVQEAAREQRSGQQKLFETQTLAACE